MHGLRSSLSSKMRLLSWTLPLAIGWTKTMGSAHFTWQDVRQWCVYGLVDGVDLLYVGSTCDMYRRLSHHRSGKFRHIDNLSAVILARTETEPECRSVERRLIYELKPAYNVDGKPLVRITPCATIESHRNQKGNPRGAPKKQVYSDDDKLVIRGVWHRTEGTNKDRVKAVQAMKNADGSSRCPHFNLAAWYKQINS
jgi:hypothetical protein